MDLLIDKTISSVIQLFLFAIIPFIWWFISARKINPFVSWIGLKKVESKDLNKTILWTIGVSIGFLLVSIFILFSIKDVETATSNFKGLGANALPAIIIYALFNTALPEEILFRGFLLKRLSSKFGFTSGNIIQAILFGLLHGMMFISMIGPMISILIVIFTGTIAWFMGYINEKKANGSIIPSWTIHAVANLFSGICAAFLIL